MNKKQMEIELSILEAQLEGIFRQMYQACTQQNLRFHLGKYVTTMGKAAKLMSEMEHIVATFVAENADA